MKTSKEPCFELAVRCNLVEVGVQVVEAVALHFEHTAELEAHIICDYVINAVARLFKIFSCVGTFFLGGQALKINTFANVGKLQFFVVAAAECKNLFAFDFVNFTAHKLIDILRNLAGSATHKVNLWIFVYHFKAFVSAFHEKHLVLPL